MSSSILIIVLGPLGLSMGLPVEEPYDPLGFYQSTRTVGDTDAPEGYALHMVAIVFGELVKSFICGGALVTRGTVRGQIGSNSLSNDYSVIRFSGHENHPEWDNWLIKNDVGILHLAQELPKDGHAKPIELNFEWVGGGERVHLTGWGSLSVWGVLPDRQQILQVDTLSPKECEERVRQANNDELGPSPAVDRAVEICTMHKRGAGVTRAAHWRGGAGLVGRAAGRARAHPDVHARVSGVKGWLRRALGLAGDLIEE